MDRKRTAPRKSSSTTISANGSRVFARYENRKDDYHIPGARSALPPTTVGTSDNIRRVNFWTFGDVATLRPNVINEFRAGVVILVSASSGELNGQAMMDQIGIQGLPNRGVTSSQPYFNISGDTGNSINLLNPVNDGHAQFADNLSWIHGRHTMKFGVEEVSWFDNRFQPNSSGNPILGTYTFSTRFTGNAYADFLLGLPNQVTRMEPYRPQYIRARDWSFYGRTISKSRRRLTLMYGLRYEYNGPAYTLNDNIFWFDLATGQDRDPERRSARLHHSAAADAPFRSRRPTSSARAARCGIPTRTTSRRDSASLTGWETTAARSARRMGHLLFALLRRYSGDAVGRAVLRHHRQHQ